MRDLVFLVYKDLVAAKWFLLAALPIYVLQLATLDVSPPAVMVLTLLFSMLFAFGNIGIEETQGTEATWCSLPLSRERIVVGRYLTTTLGVLVGLGLSGAINGPGIGALALVFFTLQMAVALYLPCYFRFGAGRGLMVFCWVALGLFAAIALAGAALSVVTQTDFTPDQEQIEAATAWFRAVEAILASSLVLVVLLATTASAALSVRWYGARDC